MTVFKFRYEPLLRLNMEQRDRERLSVAEANRAVQILESKIHQKQAEIADEKAKTEGDLQGKLSVDKLLSRGRYEMLLVQELNELNGQLKQVLAELELRERSLVLADQEVKRIEKLREIAFHRHGQREAKASQEAMDEAASIQFRRSQLESLKKRS